MYVETTARPRRTIYHLMQLHHLVSFDSYVLQSTLVKKYNHNLPTWCVSYRECVSYDFRYE